jgi:hypothetical protein
VAHNSVWLPTSPVCAAGIMRTYMLFVIREEFPPLIPSPKIPFRTVQAALGCRTIVDS